MTNFPLRINKYLAEAGYCSRREADTLIQQGLVTVNDQIITLGTKVEQGDRVKAKGKLLTLGGKKVYLAFYKPVGVICTTDDSKPDNIINYIKYPTRIFPVGRLDVATSGLIILTNDGELVNKISRRENNVEKEYLVRVDRAITDDFLKSLQSGVEIGGRRTLPAKVNKISERKFSLTITEGKNRQVRRMCEDLGYKVIKLVRTRIGKLGLDDMETGDWRELSVAEVQEKLIAHK